MCEARLLIVNLASLPLPVNHTFRTRTAFRVSPLRLAPAVFVLELTCLSHLPAVGEGSHNFLRWVGTLKLPGIDFLLPQN